MNHNHSYLLAIIKVVFFVVVTFRADIAPQGLTLQFLSWVYCPHGRKSVFLAPRLCAQDVGMRWDDFKKRTG